MKLHVDASFAVSSKFLYAWSAYHNLNFDIENTLVFHSKRLSNKGHDYRILKDLSLVARIKSDFTKFKKSKKTFDEFFGRQIIFCEKVGSIFRVKAQEIVADPLFVWLPCKNAPDLKVVNYGVSHTNISSKNPIKMSLHLILGMYNLSDPFQCLVELEDKYQIAVDLFATDGIDHWRSDDFPGFKGGDVRFRIKIAKNNENNTFWIPPKSVSSQNFRCRKFPGKCRYETSRVVNLKRHEKVCIDDTILVTKNVSLNKNS